MNNMQEQLIVALIDFDEEKAEEVIKQQLNSPNHQAKIAQLLEEALREIGLLWEKGEIALSQIYMSGKICDRLANKYFPSNAKSSSPKIGIATLNDFHALGKKIVISILRTTGFDLVDYGHGISEHELVEKVIADKIEILLISTLMLHSALSIASVVTLFKQKNYNIKILVGGAPFNFDSELWKQVGADGMGKNPSEAIDIINLWLKSS